MGQTLKRSEESISEWEKIVDSYSFVYIVRTMKETLIQKGSFHKTDADYLLIYSNLMKYIRKHTDLQARDPTIRDKDHDELRAYPIDFLPLQKFLELMWEESSAFPQHLTISIIKGWIVNKEFEYTTPKEFMNYLEVALQIDLKEIFFLIRMKNKKSGTLQKDEKKRLLSIYQNIQQKYIPSASNIIIVPASQEPIIHSTPEEDAWILEQIHLKISDC